MQKIIFIFLFLFTVSVSNAEEFYCWSVSGLNIRESQSPTSRIVGQIAYGQKVDIDWKSQDEYYPYEDLFLLGIEEDGTADIKFKGSWIKMEVDGYFGYVFGGYLSRYPPFHITTSGNHFECESFKDYMSRNYSLLNYNKEIWKSEIFDFQVRSYAWDHGITVIHDHNARGASTNILFADMTFNEALLFVKFEFGLLNMDTSVERNQLISSAHFYGLSASYDRCEINYPAPDGQIVILQLGKSIVISYHGSC